MMFDILYFAGCFIRCPATIGAILPSSPRLAEAIAALVHGWRRTGCTLIELGAGTGSITHHIHPALFDEYVAFECNPTLAQCLRQRFPRLAIHPCAIPEPISESYLGRDCIVVSSLPFRSLPEPARHAAADYLERLILSSPRNRLIQYTYLLREPFPLTRPGLRWRRAGRILANLPPAFLWELAQTPTTK